jgi:hypothetical protein
MPRSGFSKKAVEGILQFIGACYRDLLEEVRSGKHETFEVAVEYEINQIGKSLEQLHIDKTGRLVQRST